jgi:hypothetical protein
LGISGEHRAEGANVMSERKLATLANGVATIEGIEMTTYRVTGGQPRKAIGLLDVEGSQTSFSETDKEKISAHFFGRRPYPEIIIEIHFYQDSNERNHDIAPDYVNENGTIFWIFPFSAS